MKTFLCFIISFIFVFSHAYAKITIPFAANENFEYFVPPQEGCAIISTYFGLHKLGIKHAKIQELEKSFLQIKKPPYSMLDIAAILDEYGIGSKALRLHKKEDIFASNFTNAIIYLQKNNNSIGHFSFCFKGNDGKSWIADPLYGNKCVEFSKNSEIFNLFTGIVLSLKKCPNPIK